MKAKIAIGVIAMMLVLPALAMAQEGQENTNLGSWVSRRVIALDFQERVQNISTTEGEFAFVLTDSRGTIGRIFSDFMYTRSVYLVYGNDTANSTLLAPNEEGIFVAKLDKTGVWHIVVQASPLLPIPIIGDLLFPQAQKVVNIEKRFAVPYVLIIGGVIALVAVAGIVVVYRESKKKRLKEK